MGTRRSGRSARIALRLDSEQSLGCPIPLGVSGNFCLPLDAVAIHKVDQAVRKILSEIGIRDVPVALAEPLCQMGAHYCTNTGRLCLDIKTIDALLSQPIIKPLLAGRVSEYDLHPHGQHCYAALTGQAMQTLNPSWDDPSQAFYDSRIDDVSKAANITEHSAHIHAFGAPMIISGQQDVATKDVNALCAGLAGTQKHHIFQPSDSRVLRQVLPILQKMAGSASAFSARPFVSFACHLMRSPLCFDDAAWSAIDAAAQANMPIMPINTAQAGATSAAGLPLSLAQVMAEALFSFVVLRAHFPNVPIILAPKPFVADLRTGMMSSASTEMFLLMAGCAQMGQYYQLPIAISGGMTESKTPDHQAGVEKAMQYTLLMNCGANLVLQAAGLVAGQIGFSHTQLLLDNDSLGMAMRLGIGLRVDDAQLDLNIIRDTIDRSPGHFLGHPDTLVKMQDEYFYPYHYDRFSIDLWQSLKGQTAWDRASNMSNEASSNDYLGETARADFAQHWERLF